MSPPTVPVPLEHPTASVQILRITRGPQAARELQSQVCTRAVFLADDGTDVDDIVILPEKKEAGSDSKTLREPQKDLVGSRGLRYCSPPFDEKMFVIGVPDREGPYRARDRRGYEQILYRRSRELVGAQKMLLFLLSTLDPHPAIQEHHHKCTEPDKCYELHFLYLSSPGTSPTFRVTAGPTDPSLDIRLQKHSNLILSEHDPIYDMQRERCME
ncbi:hypothetical protein C8R44DRAFT_742537 [Mycena epipterygia]|nr:hypothetical protein C8R44DRAFT_742537 [Mycena epipterygia]